MKPYLKNNKNKKERNWEANILNRHPVDVPLPLNPNRKIDMDKYSKYNVEWERSIPKEERDDPVLMPLINHRRVLQFGSKPYWKPQESMNRPPPTVKTTSELMGNRGVPKIEQDSGSMIDQYHATERIANEDRLRNRITQKKVPVLTNRDTNPIPPFYSKDSTVQRPSFTDKLDSIPGGIRDSLGELSGGVKNFFNDPSRVALVQAGLTAMNPNSYYDKEGYGSAWEGLNRALGSGVSTYRELSKPKELSFEEQEKIKHKYKMSQIAETGKTGKTMGEFRRVLAAYNALPKGHRDRAFLKDRLEKIVRQEKSMRQKDYEYGKVIFERGNEAEIEAWKATQPKGTQIDLGGRKFIISPSGKVIYEGEVGFKPTEELSYIKDKEKTLVGTRLNTEAVVSAKLTLPASIESAGYMTKLLDMAMVHPGMKDVIGLPDNPLVLKGFMPATDAADFRAVYNQITGQQFMEAYKTLKGGGQITEIEGKKATDAMARMSTAQSEKAFLAALREFREVVLIGLAKQKTLAGVYRVEAGRGGTPNGGPPEDVSQQEWDNMDEEDKKLWN